MPRATVTGLALYRYRDSAGVVRSAHEGTVVDVPDEAEYGRAVAAGWLTPIADPPTAAAEQPRGREPRRRKPRRSGKPKGARPVLWFVTPAWRRYALSEIVFAQRARLIADLAESGIDAACVVVADDRNLKLAAQAGLTSLRAPNDWLGRKFNDGIEHACRNGADYVCPVGSDTWLDASLFLDLPADPAIVRCSRNYALVDEAGGRLGELVCDYEGGAHRVYAASLLETCYFRPSRDEIARGVDTSIQRSLAAFAAFAFETCDTHPLESVGFRSATGPQLNSYENLARYRVREHRNPWERLAERYPPDLVERLAALYRPTVAKPARRKVAA